MQARSKIFRGLLMGALAAVLSAAGAGAATAAQATTTPITPTISVFHPAPAVAAAAHSGPSINRNVSRMSALAPAIAPAVVTPAAIPVEQPPTYSSSCSGETLPINCTITEPWVNIAQFTYNFSFLPGDHVLISAGGCVQTGGSGLTWKRYVDPAADNDLYHGLITIPGTTGTLVRLLDVVGRPLVVGGRGGSLTLGYQDDGLLDNGYYSHDNGTANQCLNTGPAWVNIVIS